MAATSRHHHERTDHKGKCSVPMWMGGLPAGFCDKPAFGTPLPAQWATDGWTGRRFRTDGGYEGYVPGLACPAHGGPKCDANE